MTVQAADRCCICLEDFSQRNPAENSHRNTHPLCLPCLYTLINRPSPKCPLCRKKINRVFATPIMATNSPLVSRILKTIRVAEFTFQALQKNAPEIALQFIRQDPLSEQTRGRVLCMALDKGFPQVAEEVLTRGPILREYLDRGLRLAERGHFDKIAQAIREKRALSDEPAPKRQKIIA